MSDLTGFERKLTSALDGHLGPRRPVDAQAIAAAAIAGASRRAQLPGMSTSSWRNFALVAAAALLTILALALAFVAGQRPVQPVPPAPPNAASPALSPTPTASHAATGKPSPSLLPVPSMLPADGPFVALLLRGNEAGTDADLYVLERDGTERRVLHVSQDDPGLFDHGAPTVGSYGSISLDGWLAIGVSYGSDRYAFYQVGQGTRASSVIPFWGGTSGAWSPTGLFAVIQAGADRSPGGTDVFDPRSGLKIHLPSAISVGGGPTILWGFDGAGFITGDGLGGGGYQPINGGPYRDVMPPAADRPGPRAIGDDELAICQPDLYGLFFGDHDYRCVDASLALQNDFGDVFVWAQDKLNGGDVVSASFAADHRSILALVQTSRKDLVLVRLPEPEHGEPIASMDLDAMTSPPPAGSTFSFAGLAPDDSLVAVGFFADQVRGIIEMTGGSEEPTAHLGTLAGYVPASLASDWPTVP
jgi:hypothetical protein